jgi:hypothetical protein
MPDLCYVREPCELVLVKDGRAIYHDLSENERWAIMVKLVDILFKTEGPALHRRSDPSPLQSASILKPDTR